MGLCSSKICEQLTGFGEWSGEWGSSRADPRNRTFVSLEILEEHKWSDEDSAQQKKCLKKPKRNQKSKSARAFHEWLFKNS